jgi:hypothetical protein
LAILFPDLLKLSNVDLSDTDLSEADLSGADLSGRNLTASKLIRANLSYANLSEANLSYADLSGADLSGVDLYPVDLSDAMLCDVHLSHMQKLQLKAREELSSRSSETSNPITDRNEQNSESPSQLSLYIDPGNASAKTIQAVMEALSDVHRAAGGIGLEFRTDGLELHVFEEAR